MSIQSVSRAVTVGALAACLAVVALNACGEGVTPPPPPPPLTITAESALVSEPLPLVVSTALPRSLSLNAEPATTGGSTSGAAAERLVYVSLPSGAYPAGEQAIIRNTTGGASLAQPMREGGFDPIAISAGVGDTVEITIRAGSAVLARIAHPVPRSRPPRVVRTNPPKGKKDVALNSRVTVIFSEPIASSTLTSSSMTLSRDATVIAGSVHVLAGGLAAEFVPSVPLAPLAAHRLVLTGDIRDVEGDALAASLTVEFTTGTTSTSPVTSVEVAPPEARLEMGDALGDSVQLVVTVRSGQGVVTSREVIWSTDDASVAVVSSSGLVKARSPGVATVTATSEGLTDATQITVVPMPVARVNLSPMKTVEAGGTVFVGVGLVDRNNQVLTRRAVAWQSSDVAVATVDQRGLVTGIAQGTATITATSEGVSGTTTISVGPLLVDRIDISPAATAVTVGATVQLTARVYRCGGTPRTCSEAPGQPITWSSDNPVVATVDAAGRLTASGAGAAQITVVVNDLHAQAPATVIASVPITFSVLSAGYYFTCGLTPTGKAYCWGQNPFGELGIGVHAPDAEWRPAAVAPVPVGGNLTFVSLSVGGWHACGLTSDGAVYCWGLGLQKQLGQSGSSGLGSCEFSAAVDTPCATSPTRVSGVPPFRTLYAGGLHTCALTPNGTAYCWGGDRYGQLGDGGGVTAHGLPPTPVAGNHTFARLSAGWRHVCGLTTDGTAFCWGWNYRGQLGDGSHQNRDVPVPVAGGLAFTSLSAFGYHTCGVTTSGAGYCWGDNYYGQLGDGSQSARNVPVAVRGGPFTRLATGEFFTCGLATGGAAYCWGANWFGELGDGSGSSQSTPVAVAGGTVFTSITSGASHVCGLTTSDLAYCWGLNESGQLGDGSPTNRATPVRVVGQP